MDHWRNSCPNGVDQITSNVRSLDISRRPNGVGTAGEPTGSDRHLHRYGSLEGMHMVAEATKIVGAIKVSSCKRSVFTLPEFIATKAMVTELPRRYPACIYCIECQLWVDSLSLTL